MLTLREYSPSKLASWWRRRAALAARRVAAELEACSFRRSIEAALRDGRDIAFAEVVRLASWHELEDAADGPRKALASEYHGRLLDAFREQQTVEGQRPPRIGIYSRAGGVCALPSGYFGIVVVNSAIKFDASLALALLERINRVAEEAQEWWPPDAGRMTGELARHHDRAYGLATFTIGAVDKENGAHLEVAPGEVPSPGPRFRIDMAVHEPRVAKVEGLLREATQRSAQTRYGVGMALGTLVVAAITAIIALATSALDTTVGYAIGFAAGSLGAVVSVLQRMTNNSLRLVGRNEQLRWFGALRPLVGGLFGVLVVALMEAGLLNFQTTADASRLALLGSLAFFAGFNERFAQDALALSGRALPAPSARPAEPDPAATQVAGHGDRP